MRRKVERNISFDDERDRFYVTLQFEKEDGGKQKKQYRTVRTLAEARRVLRAHEAARDKGVVTAPANETLEEWMEYWFEDIVRPNREETTYYAYNQMWKNHLRSELGNIKLRNLTPQHLQRYYAKIKAEKGLSSNTIRKHHDLLSVALRMAVRQGRLGANPTDQVEPPKVKAPGHNFYEPEDLQRLLQLPMAGWLKVSVSLATYLGLRRGEICGLKWDCVDFVNHQVRIQKAVTSAGSKVVEKAPKNKSSERLLFCPSELEGVLLDELHQQEINQAKLGNLYNSQGFVVCWEDSQPVRPNYVSDRFSKLIRDNGLPPLTLHGLRHSFASIAKEPLI